MYKAKKNKALVAIARNEWKLDPASKKALTKGLTLFAISVRSAE